MNKHILIVISSIVLVIAYCDFVDSIRRIDKVISKMLKLEFDIKTEIDLDNKNYIFLPLKSKH